MRTFGRRHSPLALGNHYAALSIPPSPPPPAWRSRDKINAHPSPTLKTRKRKKEDFIQLEVGLQTAIQTLLSVAISRTLQSAEIRDKLQGGQVARRPRFRLLISGILLSLPNLAEYQLFRKQKIVSEVLTHPVSACRLRFEIKREGHRKIIQ